MYPFARDGRAIESAGGIALTDSAVLFLDCSRFLTACMLARSTGVTDASLFIKRIAAEESVVYPDANL